MAEKNAAPTVSPGQAQWIVERMISEQRISDADVRHILANMGEEIAELERRLAALRQARGDAPAGPLVPRSEPPARKTRKRRTRRRSKASGHPRGVAGTLAVLLRDIPSSEHAAIQAIRGDQGIQAAIKAARAAVKK